MSRGSECPQRQVLKHIVSVKVCDGWVLCGSGDCVSLRQYMQTFCLSVGLRRVPSLAQAPLLISLRSQALSPSCLPSGLFPLFTNLASFLLWEQRRCSVLGNAGLQLPHPHSLFSSRSITPPSTPPSLRQTSRF